MSAWRRIALREIPRCKLDIETAPEPATMWCQVYDSLPSDLPADSGEAAAIGRVFDFAVACGNKKFGRYLQRDSWIFFQFVVGAFFIGTEVAMVHVPRCLAWKRFEDWARVIGKSEDELRSVKSSYYQAGGRI